MARFTDRNMFTNALSLCYYCSNEILAINLILMMVLIDVGQTSPATGKCPVKNSTIPIWSNLQGIWYEYASFGDYITRKNYKCIKYKLNTSEAAVVAVYEYQNQWTGSISSTKYQIEYDGFFDFIIETDSGSESKMWILETDYYSFAILWTCVEYNMLSYYAHYESSWIITRFYKEYASVEEEIRIDEALKRNSMQRISYDLVNRDHCENFP